MTRVFIGPGGGGGAGGVSSFNGRSGLVVPAPGDYSVAQVTGAEATANKDVASGYAGLDAGAKLKTAEFPTVALIDNRGSASQDLLVFNGSSFVRLAVGSSGQQLIVRSDGTLAYATPTAIKAAAWGVVGDGTTDNATFLGNAIGTAAATGGAVELPAGTIKLNSTPTLPKPTPVAGIYDNPILIRGAGAGATVLKKGADVILIDNSGSVSAGTVTMRRGVQLQDLTLDGGNIGSQPLMRCYYAQQTRCHNVVFRNNNGGPAIQAVQFWDSWFLNTWFDNCGGQTPTIDQAFNSGTSQNGNECIRILSAQQFPQVSNSTMGYSTDNCNNLWFVNTNLTYNQVGSIYIGQVDPGNSAPHRLYFVNTKFEASGMLGPFVRAFGGHYINFHNTNFNAINLGTGVTSVDLVHFTNVSSASFSGQTFVQANGTYTAARFLSLFGGNDDIDVDGAVNGTMSAGGSGTAPFNVTGRTTAGSNGLDAGISFNGTNTNCRIRKPRGLTVKGIPDDGVLDGAEKKIVLTVPATTTSASMAATALAFAVGAGETWTAEFFLSITGSAAGMKFDIDGPVSPTRVEAGWMGSTSGAATLAVERSTAIDVATASAYGSGSITGQVRVNLSFRNGSTAGTVSLRFAAVTGTQSNSINAGSYMTARQVS